MTDEQLVQQYQSGEHSTFDELVRRYQQKIFGVCRRFLANSQDADDAAQEVFIKAFYALNRFKVDARFSTWLYKIAVNHSLNVLRSRRRKERLKLFSELSQKDVGNVHQINTDELHPLERIERLEQTQQVQKALMNLNEKQRAVIILHRYQELGYQEIADVLSISISSVESRLFRAKQKLAKLLINEK
jgi:RNA polymerase sigma-70 factor, ECF subfamily